MLTSSAIRKLSRVVSKKGLLSASFGAIYGPLGGVFALLLWSLLGSIALFLGAAVCAQLEHLRAGQREPAHDDPGPPPTRVVEG